MSYGFGRINDLAHEIHENSKAKGFWRDQPEGFTANDLWTDPHHVCSRLALIHSEVSEALEAVREDDRTGFAEELADTVIRCLDLANALRLNIEQEVVNKVGKNQARERMHGGKRL